MKQLRGGMAGFLAMSAGMLRRVGHVPFRALVTRDPAVQAADVQLAMDKRERKNVKRVCDWTGVHA